MSRPPLPPSSHSLYLTQPSSAPRLPLSTLSWATAQPPSCPWPAFSHLDACYGLLWPPSHSLAPYLAWYNQLRTPIRAHYTHPQPVLLKASKKMQDPNVTASEKMQNLYPTYKASLDRTSASSDSHPPPPATSLNSAGFFSLLLTC